MPAYCRAGQFPVWARLLAERQRLRWGWGLLPFVASAAIRPRRANGYRSKPEEPERRARLPPQGMRFGAELRGRAEIRRDSAVWSALHSFLIRGWSSHFPRALSLV